jgi:chromosomal replication initiation ATPase DnaA
MYTEEPAISLFNPAFVAKVHAKRRVEAIRQNAKAVMARQVRLSEQKASLDSKLESISKELETAMRAASEAIRAANSAIRTMQNECSATKRQRRASNPNSMSSILARVSVATGISERDILGPHRNRDIVLARQAVMYWCTRRTNKSYPQIGRFLGDRDHTTVLHSVTAYVDKRAKMGRTLRRLR